MPILQTIPYDDRTFFITFTCVDWLPLIDKTNGYDRLAVETIFTMDMFYKYVF
jgi:hypothetical protein